MPRYVLCLLAAILCFGCGRSSNDPIVENEQPTFKTEQEALAVLMEDVSTHLEAYSAVLDIPPSDSKRRYEFVRDHYRAESQMIAHFLSIKPPLSESTIAKLNEWRLASDRVSELHHLLVTNDRPPTRDEFKELSRHLTTTTDSLTYIQNLLPDE